jgi:hypothetical protein
VTYLVRRLIASLRELGFGARLLIVFLMIWTTVVMDDYRLPNSSALSILAELRVPLMILSFLLIVHSLQTLRAWNALYPVARMLERFAPVIVLVVAFAGGAVFFVPIVALDAGWGRLLSGLVVGTFVATSVLVTEVLVVRLIERLSAGRPEVMRRLRSVILGIFGAYFSCYVVLAYNGMLDTSPATTHRSEAVGLTKRSLQVGIVSHEVWWLGFRSWRRPGETEHIVIHPIRDGYWPSETWEGLPLVIEVRAGMLGLPWIDYTHIDRTAFLERVVKELPTAAVPRKELITRYSTEARWADVVRHAREYQALYPDDRRFVDGILRSVPAQSQSR